MGGEASREAGPVPSDPPVMAAIDRSGTQSRLVFASVVHDERWIAIAQSEAPRLVAWR